MNPFKCDICGKPADKIITKVAHGILRTYDFCVPHYDFIAALINQDAIPPNRPKECSITDILLSAPIMGHTKKGKRESPMKIRQASFARFPRT